MTCFSSNRLSLCSNPFHRKRSPLPKPCFSLSFLLSLLSNLCVSVWRLTRLCASLCSFSLRNPVKPVISQFVKMTQMIVFRFYEEPHRPSGPSSISAVRFGSQPASPVGRYLLGQKSPSQGRHLVRRPTLYAVRRCKYGVARRPCEGKLSAQQTEGFFYNLSLCI